MRLRYRRVIGYVSAGILVTSMTVPLAILITTALFAWPLSDPVVVRMFQTVLSLGAMALVFFVLVYLAVWGLSQPSETGDTQ